jgi:hypothetical protein
VTDGSTVSFVITKLHENRVRHFSTPVGMTDAAAAAALLVAPDIVQEGCRSQDIQAGIHVPAYEHRGPENPFTVIRTMGTTLLQAEIRTDPLQFGQ